LEQHAHEDRPAISAAGRHLALKSAAAAMLCHPLLGRLIGLAFAGRVPHRGARIRVQPGGDPRMNAYLLWGMYESAEIRFVEQYIPRNLDVVELGASIGGVSSYLAQRLAPSTRLVCVEANPDIIPILEDNLARNAPGCDVRIFAGAISAGASKTVTFELGESTLSSRLGDGGAQADRPVRTVPALTLGELLEREGLGDYALVCDIEGAEAELFSNESAAFARCRAIVIELHEIVMLGRNWTIDDLITLIETAAGIPLTARYGEVCAFVRD
jgi:FkbM family methyltransferase